MKLVMFAKHWKELDVAGLIDVGKRLGIDGYEWPVRPGFVVNPDNAGTALPGFVKDLESEGLGVSICAGDTRFTDAEAPFVEPMLAAMQECGIKFYKLGYFRFDPKTQDYWEVRDHVRSVLAKWEKLGEKYDVAVCMHTHVSPEVGCNAADVMHMIKGFNPKYIGAYLDTGHLSIGGSPFPVACSMAGEYLKLVAVKDFRRVWIQEDGERKLGIDIVPVGTGVADIEGAFKHMLEIGFDAPVCVHVEYNRESMEELLALAMNDVAVCKRGLGL